MRVEPVARRGTPPGWPCADALAPELVPGTRVGAGRFVIGAVLGRGGMATVHRSRDHALGRDVALKVMLGDPQRQLARVARFEHEAALSSRLPVHPGLVRFLHAGRLPELAGRPFLVAELVEGPTLAFRMATDLRMPARGSVGLGLGLARALVAVHGVGVVHRDLTARNVMLRQAAHEVQPILVDFGMAAVQGPGTGTVRLTRPDERPGTVTAMAPEQYLGHRAHPAMDVYALGRLLYQMLTAEDPHATVSRARLLELHRGGERVAPRLAGRGDAGPPELRALVDACLEPAPHRRPSAQEVAAGLRQVERALDRGATVLPLGGGRGPRAPTRSPAARRSRAGPVPRSWDDHTRSDRAWRLGWAAAMAVGVVLGVAVGTRTRTSPPCLVVPEPVALAWPSTVIPLVRRMPPRPVPPRAAPVPRPEGPRRAPRAHEAPVRAEAEACLEARARAVAAARRWDWPEVLRATDDPACWPASIDRTRLRLTAWIEQERWGACIDEGAHAHEPTLVRLVERCRRRMEALP